MAANGTNLELGGLWRDVVNFLGTRSIEPGQYLTLLETVLPRWASWTYFLGRAAEVLTRDRPELEADAARAALGWRLWTSDRDELRSFAVSVAGRNVSDDELEDWWLDDARGESREWSSYPGGAEYAPVFAKALGLTSRDKATILSRPQMPRFKSRKWVIATIKSDLVWMGELRMLHTVAHKTWVFDGGTRARWSGDELEFLNGYYEEQAPSLYVPGDPDPIDPFELQVLNDEQSLGMGLDGLHYCMYVLMRAAAIDLVDEVLEHSRRPSARGSLRCVECGLFVGRRALGYGQLYCSDRCKKRVAKRRYRHRVREGAVQVPVNSIQ